MKSITKQIPNNVSRLIEYIEEVALDMYPEDKWEGTKGVDELIGSCDSLFMMEDVLTKAFESKPDLFKHINFLESDDGFPFWVRPGYEWEPGSLDDDE